MAISYAASICPDHCIQQPTSLKGRPTEIRKSEKKNPRMTVQPAGSRYNDYLEGVPVRLRFQQIWLDVCFD